MNLIDSIYPMFGVSFVSIIVIFLAILIVYKGIVIVHQGYEYTIERLGRYTRSLRPGFSIIVPFVDRIGARVNMMERVLEVPSQDVITKDNAVVRVDGVIFFQAYLMRRKPATK